MFDHRVAIVTGASAGIGLSVARKLAALGCRVALVARTRGKLDSVVLALGADKAVALPLDVGDLPALERLPGQVVERFGRLDYVVNNAGLHHRGTFMERTPAELAQMVAVNLAAPIVLTRAAVPFLKKGAAVVNVASLAGFVPVRGAATYGGAKAGLRAFSFAAAEELAPLGIRVCTVSPGPVDTDFFSDELRKVAPITFSQPISSPDEVANAVLHCLGCGEREIAIPWFSGKIATLGYLSPRLLRMLRPMMERIGTKRKAEFAARKGLL